MASFVCFLLAALLAAVCFVVPEVVRLRLIAAITGLIALGLAVGAYPGA